MTFAITDVIISKNYECNRYDLRCRKCRDEGAVGSAGSGRRASERAVSKESYVANEAQSFLTRVFDGRLAPIFTHFAKHKGLEARDRAVLKRLLAELENDLH